MRGPAFSGLRGDTQRAASSRAPRSHICRVASRNGSNNPKPLQRAAASFDSGKRPLSDGPQPGQLNLSFESEGSKAKQAAQQVELIKTTGLHRAPLSGGVSTATKRYELPTPPVAVRNLIEHARFGHLCTMMSGMHHRRAGYPFGTVIDFAADGAGYPLFCLSPLAIHSRNLLEDPRCSFVVQMPGWTGLANARVTIFGDVYQLPADMQDAAREIFHAKHGNDRKERWISGNFVYFRMNKIVDIYFVGGFGTVQWIDPAEYLGSRPDEVILDNPVQTLQLMNNLFANELKTLIMPSRAIDELVFISIDANGVDIRLRSATEFNIERIGFDQEVMTQQEAVDSVRRLIDAAKAQKGSQ